MHPSPAAPPRCGASYQGLDLEAFTVPDVPWDPEDPREELDLYEALDAEFAMEHSDETREVERRHVEFAQEVEQERREQADLLVRSDGSE